MNLLKLLQATGQQDQLIGTLTKQFGLDKSQTNAVVGQVMGSLMGGMQKQTGQNGVKPLINAVMKGNHGQYLDNPNQLIGNETEGNKILGHLLGGKDVSRALAGQVEKTSGVGSAVIKKMLPMLAMAAMGAVSKNLKPSNSGSKGVSGAAGLLGGLSALATGSGGNSGGMANVIGGLLGGAGGANKSGLSNLMSMLDADKDGNSLDDIMKIAGKMGR